MQQTEVPRRDRHRKIVIHFRLFCMKIAKFSQHVTHFPACKILHFQQIRDIIYIHYGKEFQLPRSSFFNLTHAPHLPRKDVYMSEQELKKLSRADLLTLLLEQTRENDQLRARLAQTQRELADRRITIENAGSIAEASLQLNGIFEAAQAACAQYTENLRILSEAQEARCALLDRECRERCEQLEKETRQRCEQLDHETSAKCEKMVQDARDQSQSYWDAVSERIQTFSDSYVGLRQLLELNPGK